MLVRGGVAVRSTCPKRGVLTRRLAIGAVCTAMLGAWSVAAPALPSGWKYELVSPVDQLGADINFGVGSTDGNHAWIAELISISEGQGTGNFSTLAATRTASGWTLRDLADTAMPSNDSFSMLARSEDGSRALVERCPLTALGCSGFFRWERVDADGSRTTMFDMPFDFFSSLAPQYMGSSSDLSSIFFGTALDQPGILPGVDTHTWGHGLYASKDGQLDFLGYDENGVALPCGAILADTGAGAVGNGFEQTGISADGGTVAFESPDPNAIASHPTDCPGPVDVYVRTGGHSVNASAPRNGNPDQGATFVGASRDGSTVFFRTASQLVTADVDSLSDLYVYDVPGDSVSRLTPGADVSAAAVSPQGDYVYFKAVKAINGEGVDDHPNLFLYHAGAIRYITTAESDDFFIGGAALDGTRYSPTTPDGTHLLFSGNADLTNQSSNSHTQIFQYDATADQLVCISCRPDGTPPVNDTFISTLQPGGNVDQRIQSDDGRTVVFNTGESLLPQDINNGVFDVYMWHDGELSLVSTGQSSSPSILVSTDAAGHNVFFTNTDRLVPQVDQDNRKLYDARLGGGFPFNPPSPGCADDSCQPPVSAGPHYQPGGSETYTGPGNERQRARARLTLARIGGKARERLLQTGRLVLKVHSSRAGKLRVRITTPTRRGRARTLATLTRTLRKSGTVRLTIEVRRSVRATVADARALRIVVALNGRMIVRSLAMR